MQILHSLDTLCRRAIGKLDREDAARYEGYSDAQLARRPFVNVGAGRFRHPLWTNVDYASEWYGRQQPAGFVQYDLTEKVPLPFDSGSLALVYTSHTIEHVSDDIVQNLFNEAYRVLEPGGGIRVTCPDAMLLLRSVKLGKLDYWRWRVPWFEGPLSTAGSTSDVMLEDFLVREIATPRCRYYVNQSEPVEADEVRERIRRDDAAGVLDWLTAGLQFRPDFPGDHINWWSEAKVVRALKDAGFSEVWTSRGGQSLFAPMTHPLLFDSTRPANSLYVEAVR